MTPEEIKLVKYQSYLFWTDPNNAPSEETRKIIKKLCPSSKL